MSPALVIMAAGIGSRYGGLKQMDPVGPGGEFIIDYTVFDAVRSGFGKVVFVIRRDIEDAFKRTIGARIASRVAVEYVFQEIGDVPAGFSVPAERRKPWGTGQAILVAGTAVREPFGVVNADDFYGRESYEVLAGFLTDTARDSTAYAMVGFTLSNTLSDHGSVTRAICQAGPDGLLKTVVERAGLARTATGVVCSGQALTGSELASMNMWGFKPSLFGHLSEAFPRFLESTRQTPNAEFLIPTFVDELIRRRAASVRVLRTPCTWLGLTNPADRTVVVASIRQRVEAGEYPPRLWA
jgi:UTP-glucose-1-phosphate uridylyltransferase